jgi:TonB family protein
MNQRPKLTKIAASTFLAMALTLSAVNLLAQEGRKLISNPVPVYPEMAKNYRITGVVKVQVVVAPDGHIKSTQVIGGHPLLADAVKETLKNWKYAPASAESTAILEFNFHP